MWSFALGLCRVLLHSYSGGCKILVTQVCHGLRVLP